MTQMVRGMLRAKPVADVVWMWEMRSGNSICGPRKPRLAQRLSSAWTLRLGQWVVTSRRYLEMVWAHVQVLPADSRAPTVFQDDCEIQRELRYRLFPPWGRLGVEPSVVVLHSGPSLLVERELGLFAVLRVLYRQLGLG